MTELLFDPALAETRVVFGMAEAEVAQRAGWRASALVFAAIDGVLGEAAAHPEVFVDEQMIRGDAVELSVRAAVADLAVRLTLSESTVRSHAHVAATLRRCTPVLWSEFLQGEIATQNAREVASLVVGLPQGRWPVFEGKLLEAARMMAPARFRAKALGVLERLQPAPPELRHEVAATRRGVWVEADRDGMSWLNAYLPAATVTLAMAALDAAAFDAFTESDETRSMAQLRADILGDVLMGEQASRPTVSVALAIPALAMLGHSDEPAVLEGAGPIDLDTARQLAALAPSISRLLTDPFTGAVLQLDPTQYRTTAAVKRWFSIRHATCDHPGCGRRAANCDLDHTIAFAVDKQTTIQNLAPRCRKHHTLKHQTRWRVEQPPGAARPVWTSPTGHQRQADPPPF